MKSWQWVIAVGYLTGCAVLAGPITITQGGWYVGTFESDNPAIAAITVKTTEPVYIYHSIIHSTGNGIETSVNMTNVGVYDCYGIGPSTSGYHFFYGNNVQTFRADYNFVEGWDHGFYLNDPPGSPFTGAVINIDRNSIRNCQCAIGLVCMIGITGGISFNQDISLTPGGDQISIYGTTAAATFTVDNNYVQGPVPPMDASAVNFTGASILTDGFPPCVSTGILFANNQAVGYAAGGIGFAYSRYCTATGNRAVSCATDALGDGWPCYGAGMAVYEADATNVIKNNFAASINGSTGFRDDFTTSWPWGTFLNNTSLPNVDENAEYGIWQAKIRRIRIGPDW